MLPIKNTSRLLLPGVSVIGALLLVYQVLAIIISVLLRAPAAPLVSDQIKYFWPPWRSVVIRTVKHFSLSFIIQFIQFAGKYLFNEALACFGCLWTHLYCHRSFWRFQISEGYSFQHLWLAPCASLFQCGLVLQEGGGGGLILQEGGGGDEKQKQQRDVLQMINYTMCCIKKCCIHFFRSCGF